ncbi:hypothetical protein BH11CYA1_BH11CYA1_03240 [soil metagenome]
MRSNSRFISLLILAVVIGLVAFADSAFAGKGGGNRQEEELLRDNYRALIFNPFNPNR